MLPLCLQTHLGKCHPRCFEDMQKTEKAMKKAKLPKKKLEKRQDKTETLDDWSNGRMPQWCSWSHKSPEHLRRTDALLRMMIETG